MRTLKTEDGVPLHWRQWSKPGLEPARGTVLLVHGLGEHIGRYEHVAAQLNDWGWHVVGHDQRGHGASGGPRGDVPDVERLLQDLAQVIDEVRADAVLGAGPLVLLGHSMGGMVAGRFVAGGLVSSARPTWSRPVDALILSSPALDPGMSAFQKFLLKVSLPLLPHLALGNGLKPSWISRSQAVVEAYVADPMVHDRITPMLVHMIVDGGAQVIAAAPHWHVPTLLLWAGSDRCVAPRGSAAFALAAPKEWLQAHCFERMYHEILNEPEQAQVFKRMRDWLAQTF